MIEENSLSDILIYENGTLTIDDPVFRFYLDHLDFSRVRSQVNIRRIGYEYDVAVSFAGPDRPVAELKDTLEARGLEVFYDFDQQAALWGKDLRKELAKVYSQDAQFMVVCLSEHYPERDWPALRSRSASRLRRSARRTTCCRSLSGPSVPRSLDYPTGRSYRPWHALDD